MKGRGSRRTQRNGFRFVRVGEGVEVPWLGLALSQHLLSMQRQRGAATELQHLSRLHYK